MSCMSACLQQKSTQRTCVCVCVCVLCTNLFKMRPVGLVWKNDKGALYTTDTHTHKTAGLTQMHKHACRRQHV